MIVTLQGMLALLIAANAAARMEQLYAERRNVERQTYAQMTRIWP